LVRVLITVILPLLLPTALYLLWVGTLGAPHEDGAMPWTSMPWLWLVGAGAALLAIVLFVVAVGFGTTQQGVYVAPRWQNGHIIPGHIVPKAP
jgi:hypothetical protein